MESQVMIFDEPSSPFGEGRGAEPWTAAEVLPSFDRSPESRQVEGRGHQRHFHPPLTQSAQAEAPHAALFFQHSEHRFDPRLPWPVASLSRRTAQPRPHPAMFGRITRHLQRPASLPQLARQVRIRSIAFNPPLLQFL